MNPWEVIAIVAIIVIWIQTGFTVWLAIWIRRINRRSKGRAIKFVYTSFPPPDQWWYVPRNRPKHETVIGEVVKDASVPDVQGRDSHGSGSHYSVAARTSRSRREWRDS